MNVYIRVSSDHIELPVDFDTNAKALADRWNTTKNVIYSSISHKRGYWRKVEIDEESNEYI